MTRQLPLPVSLDGHARFETFYAGPNQNALQHLRALPGAGIPVSWIWGAPGCGKSHLLQAVCAQAEAQGREAAYLPLAPAAGLAPEALRGWDTLQLACVDDLHEVAGNAAWERALFVFFNELADRGGTMLVAATSAPSATRFGMADLASRLSWGPVFRILPLEDHERISALKGHARHRGLELADEVGAWLLRRLPRDMAYLCRVLDGLDRASLAAGRRLTVPFVRDVLEKRGVLASAGNPEPGGQQNEAG